MSGRFIHVRDSVEPEHINQLSDLQFKLRRVE